MSESAIRPAGPTARSGSAAASDPGSGDSERGLEEPHGGADPLVGLVVADRYRVVARIGRGGMGIVYRVEHVRLGKPLAMKLLAGELSMSRDTVRRFKQEALAASQLSCRHTVQVYDFGVWQHLTYLVMELVDGVDLGRLLHREGPMPAPRLEKLIAEICSSLDEAHGKGIVHRDIKPENIMVVDEGRGRESAKVVDFGLAKLREANSQTNVTLQGTIIGTPYCISPEQILGDPVDGRADIYALGVVMHRMLTGNYPFDATTAMAMFAKHLNESPRPLAASHPELGISQSLSDAVLRCLAKDPADRFRSVEELRAALLRDVLPLGGDPEPREGHPNGDRLDERGHVSRHDDDANATRLELEAFEVELRRKRHGAWLLAGLVAIGLVAAASWRSLRRDTAPNGLESEPNDNGGTADDLPFGAPIRGTLGKRLDDSHGDQDVYRVVVPGEGTVEVALELGAVPQYGLCAALLRTGEQRPPAIFCTGAIGGQPLDIPRFRVDAGAHLVVVSQDRNVPPQANYPVALHESISDSYVLTVRSASEASADLEPNDTLEGAALVEPGSTVVGSLGFVDDVDFICSTTGHVSWQVDEPGRRTGTVLELTPIVDGRTRPLVRVHGRSSTLHPRRAPMAADVRSPYSTPRCAGERCCIKLRLTSDPWSAPDAVGPLPDGSRYRLKVEPTG